MAALELYPKDTKVAFFAKGHKHDRAVCTVVESDCVQKGKNKYYKYTLAAPDGKEFKAEDGENGVRIEKVKVTRGIVLMKTDQKVMIITEGPTFNVNAVGFTQAELDGLVQDKQVDVIHTEFLPRFVAYRVI